MFIYKYNQKQGGVFFEEDISQISFQARPGTKITIDGQEFTVGEVGVLEYDDISISAIGKLNDSNGYILSDYLYDKKETEITDIDEVQNGLILYGSGQAGGSVMPHTII